MSKIATRASFGKTLLELGRQHENIVCMDADLSKSTQSQHFAKEFPNRFFEMGIQEANMIGAAAGLSFAGKIPFICSFGAFLTGRFDQIRMSIAYSGANVKLVGTHCGVGIGEDGHSQMGLEDIALMRSIPGMTILQPATDQETREMMEWAIAHQGPVYFRLTRQGLRQFEMPNFKTPGVFHKLREGEDVAFLANGGLLEAAFEAANELSEKGTMNAAVYNASSSKPMNDEFMRSLCARYQLLYVFEDHTIMGGTGTAVAEWMSQYAPHHMKVIRYGVKDVFGESGTPSDLYDKHGFTQKAIVANLL